MDTKHHILFALNETINRNKSRPGGGGNIFEYHFDPRTGQPESVSVIPTLCPNPSYLSLSADGRYMIVANHGSKNYITKIAKDIDGKYFADVQFDDSLVELFRMKEDGCVGELVDFKKHLGSGPSGARQFNSHPHSVVRSPSGKLFAVCDKGSDQIYMYQIDYEKEKLVLCNEPLRAIAGSMPRYCAFHPKRPYFYNNSEGTTDVYAYKYDEDGKLYPIGVYQALKEKTSYDGKPSEQQGFCVHPSGKYLYDVINGLNSVSVFSVHPTDGSLTLLQNMNIEYQWARGGMLSPDGRFYIVSCLKGDRILVFRVGYTGKLIPTGFEYEQYSPAYITFWNTGKN